MSAAARPPGGRATSHGEDVAQRQEGTPAGPSVVMYFRDTCPYCLRAERLLRARGVRDIDKIRIDEDPDLRRQMIARTGARTVPQIFIGAVHVGDGDALFAMDQAGTLALLLQGP